MNKIYKDIIENLTPDEINQILNEYNSKVPSEDMKMDYEYFVKNIETMFENTFNEEKREERRKKAYKDVEEFRKTPLGKKYPHMLDFSLLYL